MSLEPNYDMALYWLEKSANNGNTQALWFLANGLSNGIFLKKDVKRSFPWMVKAAEAGVYGAMKQVAHMYRFGIGTEVNYEQAFIWNKKVVELEEESGFVDGFRLLQLSAMYYCGMGVEKNFAEAEKWQTIANEKGQKNRPDITGKICYETGEYTLAKELFEQSFNENSTSHIDSAGMLGILYQEEQSYTKAFEWYSKGAERGDSRSINNLGDLYENGYGVPVDYAKAKEYYLKAIEMDNPWSYMSMGQLYKLGRGVEQNLDTAKDWYGKACDMGVQEGCEAVKELSHK